jgi:hypothetical protein
MSNVTVIDSDLGEGWVQGKVFDVKVEENKNGDIKVEVWRRDMYEDGLIKTVEIKNG